MQSLKSLKLIASFSLALATLIAIPGVSGAQQLPGVKCIVDGGRQCKTKYAVAFVGGEVFFSSQAAADRFSDLMLRQQPATADKQREAWRLRANHQLALTGQYKQCRCVVTDAAIGEAEKATGESVSTVIAGLRVYVKDVAAKEKLLAQKRMIDRVKLVFASNQFAKNFALSKVEKAGNVRSIADQSAVDLSATGLSATDLSARLLTTKK